MRDPCPERIAAAQATVHKHTLGTRAPVTLQQLDEACRVVESLMKNSRWVLVSPTGEMWAEHDAAKLIGVLLTRVPGSIGDRDFGVKE